MFNGFSFLQLHKTNIQKKIWKFYGNAYTLWFRKILGLFETAS